MDVTNIVVSRLPKCQPTETAHACTKKVEIFTLDVFPSSVQLKLSLADSHVQNHPATQPGPSLSGIVITKLSLAPASALLSRLS